jgi:hypothetical protein
VPLDKIIFIFLSILFTTVDAFTFVVIASKEKRDRMRV